MRTTARHIITWAILGAAAALAALSCEKDPSPQPADMQASESVELSVGETAMAEARSGISPSETAVRNSCFAIYDGSGNLVKTCYFATGGGSVSGLVKGRRYHVHALANMGDRSSDISGYSSEIAMKSGLTCGIGTYSSLSSGGIPMASGGPVEFTCGGVSSVTVPVERLAAKYNVRIDRSLLREGEVTVKRVALRQAAYEVRPFEPDLSLRRTGSVGDGDTASPSDLSSLNEDGSVAFYMLENRQGTLLPGNTDPWSKVPDNIAERKDQCTYLEMECSYDSETLSSDNVTYRMYLGENNTTNFDISRNTVYTLTFRPTDAGMGADSWKIDPGEVTTYSTASELKVTPSSASVMVGAARAFTATWYTYYYVNGVLTETASRNVTQYASWTSSSTAVATVSAGTATGLSAGTTTVRASYAGQSAAATLSVQNRVETRYRIVLSPAETTVNEGGTVTYTVTRYSDTYTNCVLTSTGTAGTVIANSGCSWSVTAGSLCANVSTAGVATGKSMGTATIRAALKTDGTVYATAVLNVDYTINVNPGSGGTGSGGNKF